MCVGVGCVSIGFLISTCIAVAKWPNVDMICYSYVEESGSDLSNDAETPGEWQQAQIYLAVCCDLVSTNVIFGLASLGVAGLAFCVHVLTRYFVNDLYALWEAFNVLPEGARYIMNPGLKVVILTELGMFAIHLGAAF